MVSLGYLVMFAIVFDYSRLDFELGGVPVPDPARREDAAGFEECMPISSDDRKTIVFGWINAVVPRVGIVRPF